MVTSKVDKNTLFVGIDGGGTKCKAVIVDGENNILGVGVAGPANPLYSFEQTTTSITQSVQIALQEAKLKGSIISSLVAGIGLAGVNLPSLMTQMQQWFHPFKQMSLTTDLNIACIGAHDGNAGAIFISGTGSCGYSSAAEKQLMIGGYGFPYGDQGSGAWVGQQVVTKVICSLDGMLINSIMNSKLLKHLHCNNSLDIVEKVNRKSASFFAELAYIAFDSATIDDRLALTIINEGAQYLTSIADKLWLKEPNRLSFIGGLSPSFTPYLAQHVIERLSEPCHPPEIGAIIYIKKQLGLQP